MMSIAMQQVFTFYMSKNIFNRIFNMWSCNEIFFSVYCPKSQKSHTQRRLNEKQRDREWKNIVNVMRFAIIASSLLRNSCGIHDLSLICHERQVKEKRISMALIYDSSRNVEGILKTSTSLFYLFMV